MARTRSFSLLDKRCQPALPHLLVNVMSIWCTKVGFKQVGFKQVNENRSVLGEEKFKCNQGFPLKCSKIF